MCSQVREMKRKLVDYESSSDEEENEERHEIPPRKYRRVEELLEWTEEERKEWFTVSPHTEFVFNLIVVGEYDAWKQRRNAKRKAHFKSLPLEEQQRRRKMDAERCKKYSRERERKEIQREVIKGLEKKIRNLQENLRKDPKDNNNRRKLNDVEKKLKEWQKPGVKPFYSESKQRRKIQELQKSVRKNPEDKIKEHELQVEKGKLEWGKKFINAKFEVSESQEDFDSVVEIEFGDY